ncbi:odorant receptor 4-like [Schistocerca americana]|uniref:odorant receptor 4-like n=1 Tax=Schistocerca americana TaxID=7009 RepID=UPI001F4FBA79|nr:odorant receptor 4-like [Schistocerca americana]
MEVGESLLGPSAAILGLLRLWRAPPAASGVRVSDGACLLLLALCPLLMALKLTTERSHDLLDLTWNVFILFASSLVFVKVACFVHQRAAMQEAVQLLLSCRNCHYGGDSGSATRHSYQRLGRTIYFGIQVMVTMAWMGVVFLPLLNHGISTTGEELTAKEYAPLPIWLPFKVHSSPSYEFTYAVQVLWLAFVAETSICIDCIFMNLMLMITAELHILNSTLSTLQKNSFVNKVPVVSTNEITENMLPFTHRRGIKYSKQIYENLIPVEGTEDSSSDTCNSYYAISQGEIKQRMYQQLLKNIQYHQTIIKCTASAQKAMNFSVFVLLSTNIIEICSSIFSTAELLKNDMPVAAMKTLCMIPVILCQSGMYCFFGQMIADESEKLLQSAYNSGWYECDIRFRNVSFILMLRVTCPLKITVGKTMSLSRQTFLQVLNGAYALLNMAYHVNK